MAQEDVRLSGTQLDSTRVVQEGLTVTAFAHGTTTPAIATDTTDSNGEWDFTLTTPGRYDVQIVDGSETFAILARDKFQVTELTTRNPTTALPALSAYSTTSEASSLVATFGFRPSTEASGVETPDTPSDNDEGYINFTLSNDNATPQQWDAARITWIGTDVSDGTEDADLEFETMVNGTLATALKIGVSGATGSIIKDEDNMVSDSAVHLATQQSIKAYVDAQVGTVNSLAEVLALGNSTGGTNLVVTAGDVITIDTINETTAASGVTIDSVLLKDNTVLAGTMTVAAGSLTDSSGAISFDNENLSTTGTLSAGASTFTTATADTVSITEDGKIDFSNTSPGTSGDATGIIFSFTAGATLAVGDVVYMGTGGKVLLSDADQVTTMPALGICTSASTDTNPVDVMIQGIMKLTGWSFTIGNDIFVSATDGDVTETAPSGSGDTVQKVGVATASDAAYFNFNTTEVLLA